MKSVITLLSGLMILSSCGGGSVKIAKAELKASLLLPIQISKTSLPFGDIPKDDIVGKRLVICGFDQMFVNSVNFYFDDLIGPTGLLLKKTSMNLIFKENGLIQVKISKFEEQGQLPIATFEKRWKALHHKVVIEGLGEVNYQKASLNSKENKSLGSFHLKVIPTVNLDGFTFLKGNHVQRVGYRFYNFEKIAERELRQVCGARALAKLSKPEQK